MALTIYDSRKESEDDELFNRWYQSAGEKYFLNWRSPQQAMLHRVPCPHYVFGSEVRLANTPKVCAVTIARLREWAAEHGVTVSPCTDCKL